MGATKVLSPKPGSEMARRRGVRCRRGWVARARGTRCPPWGCRWARGARFARTDLRAVSWWGFLWSSGIALTLCVSPRCAAEPSTQVLPAEALSGSTIPGRRGPAVLGWPRAPPRAGTFPKPPLTSSSCHLVRSSRFWLGRDGRSPKRERENNCFPLRRLRLLVVRGGRCWRGLSCFYPCSLSHAGLCTPAMVSSGLEAAELCQHPKPLSFPFPWGFGENCGEVLLCWQSGFSPGTASCRGGRGRGVTLSPRAELTPGLGGLLLGSH